MIRRGSIPVRVFLTAALCTVLARAQFTIRTAAGGGPPDGVSATSVNLGLVNGVAVGPTGLIFIASEDRVYRMDPNNGQIRTVAGGNYPIGFVGDGGPAVKAQLYAGGIAVDGAGNLYIADTFNHRVRKVSTAGIITTIAGTGEAGSGSGQLNFPRGVAVDVAGVVYVANEGDGRVVRVGASNTLTTVVTAGPSAPAVVVDQAGFLYVCDRFQHRLLKVSPAGTVRTFAGTGQAGYSGDGGPAVSAQLHDPSGLSLDESGNLLIVDSATTRVRKVTSAGIISTVAGNGLAGFTEDGTQATAAKLSLGGVAAGSGQNFLIVDGSRIRRVSASGGLSTIAGTGPNSIYGDGGPAGSAQVGPRGIALDRGDNLLIAELDRARKVNAAGVISTIAGTGAQGFSGDGGPATDALLSALESIVTDAAGNVYLADTNGNARIRRVNPAGIIQTVAGNGTPGSSGDGGLATNARIGIFVNGIVFDSAGNMYFSENNFSSPRVRRVTPAGIISTIAGTGEPGFSRDGGPAVAAKLNWPAQLAIDAAGNLFIADTLNHRVRRVSPAGIITTVAGDGTQGFAGDGGAAVAARLDSPGGIALDSSGNLYISDTGNHRIRRVTSGGIITTIAGDGTAYNGGDGGFALGAQLHFPRSLAFDSTGKLYVTTYQRVRVLIPGGISVDPVSLSFTYQVGGAVPAARSILVTNNSAPVAVTAAVTAGASWLSLNTTSAVTPATFTVSVNPSGLPGGVQTGNIRLTSGGLNLDVPVNLQIAGCTYSVIPALTTTPTADHNTPASGLSSSLSVNATPSGCVWTAATNAPWITITSGASGAGNGTVAYRVAANTGESYRSGTISIAGTSYPVTQAGGLYFVPVVPCRVSDTRNANGPFGGPRMNAGESRSFAIPNSTCGIPSNAAAYSLNVTVVPAGPLSYLALWPAGQPRPLVSTLNSFDGRIKANAAIVPSGSDGAVSVFVTDAADVILDINGYFVAAAGNGLSFYPTYACRVADTRLANGTFGGPLIAAGQFRSFPIRSLPGERGNCRIPENAQAYSLNITAIPNGPLAFLTTWPSGSARPLASTLNAFTGAVTANAALVPAGTNGAVSIFATNDTHVAVDITGYFAPPGGIGAQSFHTLTPCRILDTRLEVGTNSGPSLAAGQTRSLPPSSSCGLPQGLPEGMYSLNATVVPRSALGYLSLWSSFDAQPLVSTLNALDGSVVSNAAIAPINLSIFATDATDVILDINGYFSRDYFNN